MRLEFVAPLVRTRHGRATIHLVELPEEVADLLNDLPLARHGFGSIKVEAQVGTTIWKTSVFPDGSGFLLLIAKRVIGAELLVADAATTVALTV